MQVSLARQERPCETLSGNFISKKCVSLFEKERERVWPGRECGLDCIFSVLVLELSWGEKLPWF